MNKSGLITFRLLILLLLSGIKPGFADARSAYDEGLKKARQQAEAGEYPAAERTLNLLGKRYPGNPEIEAASGRIRYWQHDYKEAARLFRKSLSRKDDSSVRELLSKAETMQKLNEADRLTATGDDSAAEIILKELFLDNRLSSESGHRLGQLYLRKTQPAKARDVYLRLSVTYPAEADFAILAVQAAADSGDTATALRELTAMPQSWQDRNDVMLLKVRLLTGSGRAEEALSLLQASRKTLSSPELAAAKSRLTTLTILQKADALAAAGRHEEAEKLLLPLWSEGSARYEAGIRLGRSYFVLPDYEKAYEVYRALSAEYPQERDFKRLQVESLAAKGDTGQALDLLRTLPTDPYSEALRGRLLYRMGRLSEAVEAFRSSLAGQKSVEMRKELAEVETAALLVYADSLANGGDHAGALEIWQDMERSGRDNYTASYRLGMAAIKRRDYPEARRRFASLAGNYPDDKDFRHLYIESLLLNKEEATAGQLVASMPGEDVVKLAGDRPDLLYRIRRNNLRLFGGGYIYSKGLPSEQSYGLTLTQKIAPVTGVFSANRISRFGLTDTQFGLELHSGLGKQAGSSGYLAATFSSDPSFSARYSIGGEYTRSWKGAEPSLGLFRLSFRNSDAHILIPGLTLYPAESFSFNERIFIVVDTGAVTFLSTLGWEPDHRFRSFFSVGVGNAAERLTSSEDTSRYFTLSSRLSGEYRLTPAISVGSEFGYEYRRGLYTRSGATFFARYWW